MAAPPTSLEDIKTPWLEEVLGISCLKHFSITSSRDLVGYASNIGFLNILGCESDLPTDYFIKVPPKEKGSRAAVLKFGGFQREIMFYRHLAPVLPVRSPRPYATELEINTGAGILILEDCSSMKSFRFNQAPPRKKELRQIVRTLARLHAYCWNQTDPLLANFRSLRSNNNPDEKCPKEIAAREWLESYLTTSLPNYMSKLAVKLPQEISRLQNHVWCGKNKTLVHGDFHLQNVLYDPDALEDPVIVIDWDSFDIGCGAHDLAYMAALLPTNYRRRHEDVLLATYHDHLISQGVTDYSSDEFYADYRMGTLFAPALQPILAQLMRDSSEERDLLLTLSARQFQLILDHQAEVLLT